MMNREIVKVVEKGVELDIPFHACVLYHGKDSIGGLSLGYRLMYWALNYLSEDGEIPRREDISFKTAFPGPGLRDAVEMISRAVTKYLRRLLCALLKAFTAICTSKFL